MIYTAILRSSKTEQSVLVGEYKVKMPLLGASILELHNIAGNIGASKEFLRCNRFDIELDGFIFKSCELQESTSTKLEFEFMTREALNVSCN